jgi:4-carboxymuconolactone decarboxylase
MAALTEKSKIGAAVIAEMMSPEFSKIMQQHVESGAFGATLGQFGLEHSFADVWGRDGMPRKYRSLVLLGALIAMHQPAELRNHVRIALNNGVTVKELEEVLLTASPYVGLPRVSSAMTEFMLVLRERGLLQDKTAEERGLL